MTAFKRIKGTWIESGLYAAVMIAAMASPSLAQLAPVQTTLQQLISIFTGAIGTSLAVLSVIGLGLAAVVGRLTWTFAGSCVLGIVLIFGSAQIVEYFKSAAGGQ